MSVPLLESCCCGCSLSLGTKIVGWLCMIGAIASMFTFWMCLVVLDELNMQENNDLQPLIPMLKVFLWILIVIASIWLVFTSFLLKGAYQGKPACLKVWVYFSIVILIIDCFIKVEKFLSFSRFSNPLELLSIPLISYSIWVVYSFYRQQIQDSNNC